MQESSTPSNAILDAEGAAQNTERAVVPYNNHSSFWALIPQSLSSFTAAFSGATNYLVNSWPNTFQASSSPRAGK